MKFECEKDEWVTMLSRLHDACARADWFETVDGDYLLRDGDATRILNALTELRQYRPSKEDDK